MTDQTAPTCSICLEPIRRRYYKQPDTDELVCSACRHRHPVCARCGRVVPGMERTGERYVCATCLGDVDTCTACGEPLTGKTYSRPGREGRFCRRCVYTANTCAACRAPVGDDHDLLSDGRRICPTCRATAVADHEQAMDVLYLVRDAAHESVGVLVQPLPSLEVVDAEQMGALVASRYRPDQRYARRPLGLFRKGQGREAIYLESHLPFALAAEALAHESAHAWLERESDPNGSEVAKEGFAEWVAYHVLEHIGLAEAAEHMKERKDHYGRGLNWMLNAEEEHGREGAFEVMEVDCPPLPEEVASLAMLHENLSDRELEQLARRCNPADVQAALTFAPHGDAVERWAGCSPPATTKAIRRRGAVHPAHAIQARARILRLARQLDETGVISMGGPPEPAAAALTVNELDALLRLEEEEAQAPPPDEPRAGADTTYVRVEVPLARMSRDEVAELLGSFITTARREGAGSLDHWMAETDDVVWSLGHRWLTRGSEAGEFAERMEALQEVALEEHRGRYELVRLGLSLLQHDVNRPGTEAFLALCRLTPFSAVEQLQYAERCQLPQLAMLFARLSKLLGQRGLASLRQVRRRANDSMLKRGLSLVVENTPPDRMRALLDAERERRSQAEAKRLHGLSKAIRIMLGEEDAATALKALKPWLKSEGSRQLARATPDGLRRLAVFRREAGLNEEIVGGMVVALALARRRGSFDPVGSGLVGDVTDPLLWWGLHAWNAGIKLYDRLLPQAIQIILRQYDRRWCLIRDGCVALQRGDTPDEIGERLSVWCYSTPPLPPVYEERPLPAREEEEGEEEDCIVVEEDCIIVG